MRRIGWVFLIGLLALGCAREERVEVDVFFTADVQGFYFSRPEPRLDNQEAGGYAILKNFLQTRTTPFLLFDGGNWFGPSAEGTLSKDAYVTQLAASIPFTAGTLTDKDLAFGWPVARGIVKELNYPFVVSNLRLENQIPWPLHDYQIRTVEGIKFGIFGLMPSLAQNQARLAGLSTIDPFENAQHMATLLAEKEVDYIIVLSALGLSGAAGRSNTALASEVDHIDLILSSNQDNENPETEQINKTWIVYPGSKLDSVGKITLQFDKSTHQLKSTTFTDEPLLKNKYGQDEALAAQAEKLLNQTRRNMARVVTTAKQEIKTDLKAQSALGSVLSQCLHRWAKLDGAILNAASIRSSLPAGNVTEFDLYKTYPYGDNITYVTLKGAALTKALEASLNMEDNFPQIAGFSVQYADTPSGKKITRVTLDNGRIIRPQDTYRIAVTDHILAGGFGHEEFINALEFKSTFVEARQIMRSCLARQKPVAVPNYTNRWKLVQ
ncbi:MAG: bifunctional metallophosphatase/5'-nucleotidase [Elusimicrobiaceae bacterium]|nr:bifunctional metallophosphatase/5'-nucleotidase [Elusimicrobiaceae bacterium]